MTEQPIEHVKATAYCPKCARYTFTRTTSSRRCHLCATTGRAVPVAIFGLTPGWPDGPDWAIGDQFHASNQWSRPLEAADVA